MLYIGQTGRSFEVRKGEHVRSYRLDDGKSNYAAHLLDFNHIFNDVFRLLHVSNRGAQLNALEALEINKNKSMNVLLNDQLDINR